MWWRQLSTAVCAHFHSGLAYRPDVLQVEVSTVKKRVPLREQAQHTRLARDSTIHLEGWETTPEAQKRWVRDPSGC